MCLVDTPGVGSVFAAVPTGRNSRPEEGSYVNKPIGECGARCGHPSRTMAGWSYLGSVVPSFDGYDRMTTTRGLYDALKECSAGLSPYCAVSRKGGRCPAHVGPSRRAAGSRAGEFATREGFRINNSTGF